MVSEAFWRFKSAADVGRATAVRAETYAALLRRTVPTLSAPPPDALRPYDIPSVKELGAGDRVLAEIDEDGYAFAAQVADEPLFNRREKRVPRPRHDFMIVLRKGEVLVEKHFNPRRSAGPSMGDYLAGQLALPFFNEAAALVHLRSVAGVPRLRHVDLGNRILRVDYIHGQTLRKQVAESGAPLLDAGAEWSNLDEHTRTKREIAAYAPHRGAHIDAIGHLAADILRAGVAPLDMKLGNILVGEKTGRHYWLDFEIAHVDSCPRHEETVLESRALLEKWFGVDLARFG